jgi:hypothetical protein
MDYQQIALGIHLIGFALGLGGATISDIMFFRALRKRQITEEAFTTLSVLSKVIWAGLFLLVSSGLVIFWLIYSERGSIPMLASPRWQTKLILVAIVLINGFVFKQTIFPFLKSLVGTPLSLNVVSPKIWRLAVSGTISVVSWYGIFLVTMLPRTFRPQLAYFLAVYFAILIVGMVVSKSMIARTLK